jgi:hypothetical protein
MSLKRISQMWVGGLPAVLAVLGVNGDFTPRTGRKGPTYSRRVRPSRRRGYVLLEALIGGALVAVVLGALYVQAGFAHTKIVAQARRTTAIHLAQTALEREIALGFNRARPRPEETVQAGGARYARTVTIGDESALGGVRFKDVIVEVKYDINGDAKDVRASSRVWQP